jgi:biotin synthase
MNTSHSVAEPEQFPESPDHVRLSLAAAMTLGFVPGWFYRNAKLGCINLLLTYQGGCKANCSFCGLAAEKHATRGTNFIRVPWKSYPTSHVIEGIQNAPSHVSRVCISMITHPRCKADVLTVCKRIARETDKAVSLLISPTLLQEDDLRAMKDAGADRVGVAIDAAIPEIFEQLRGKPVHGPHSWEKYWHIYEKSVSIFGKDKAGVHLICGLGETESQMVEAIAKARNMGGFTHLFCFFPERGSLMEKHPVPKASVYRRVQLARWLIDNDVSTPDLMRFDQFGRITDYGLPEAKLQQVIHSGVPFQTSGCPGPDGKVACNRPYGNEKPGPDIRNYPFPPEPEDLRTIVAQLKDYSD